MLYNLVVQLVQYCLFHCTFDCLQLPRLGWRPSALLGFACAVLHYCAPQCTIFKLNAFIATRRARAPAPMRARAPAPKAALAAAALSGGEVSVTVPRRRRRRRRRQRRQVHGQRRLLRWDLQVPVQHHCRRKAPHWQTPSFG